MFPKRLTAELVRAGMLCSQNLIQAFEKVDRADFVPEDLQDEAYVDYALPIGYGQTISQPSTVTLMFEFLQPQKGQRVLDVGAGSGWTTALLAYIVGRNGKVIGLERIPQLVQYATENLYKYNYAWAEVQQANANLGDPANAPYDRILVSAGARALPNELTDQLKPDGVMVIPVQDVVLRATKDLRGETKIDELKDFRFMFVPLIY